MADMSILHVLACTMTVLWQLRERMTVGAFTMSNLFTVCQIAASLHSRGFSLSKLPLVTILLNASVTEYSTIGFVLKHFVSGW